VAIGEVQVGAFHEQASFRRYRSADGGGKFRPPQAYPFGNRTGPRIISRATPGGGGCPPHCLKVDRLSGDHSGVDESAVVDHFADLIVMGRRRQENRLPGNCAAVYDGQPAVGLVPLQTREVVTRPTGERRMADHDDVAGEPVVILCPTPPGQGELRATPQGSTSGQVRDGVGREPGNLTSCPAPP
jgi:hypothetical protein